ncbi:MAG TPA: hypothetical protein VFV78_08490 [Vicinamibacterales bacterium]|nr:hypothetical protein [Vicinamibacterales bacterium]
MKTISALILLGLLLVPAATSAQAVDITGKWNAKSTLTAQDGSGRTQTIPFTFEFTQKGKTLTGTISPDPARIWKIEKGVVNGDKVSFQVQQPDGPLRTLTLTYAKGRLTGTMKLERDGQTAETAIEADRAK